MRIKLFGTEIYVSFLFAAVIALMLALDHTGLVIPTVFAVFMHELGHLFAMWVTECSPKQIRLIPTSVQIVRGFGKKKHGEIIIALCGPAVNLVLFFALYCNHLLFKGEAAITYAALNLVIGIFNLLPVNGLDGGTVLYQLLSAKYNPDRAALVLKCLTAVCGAAVFCCAVALTAAGRLNISLYIVALYLLVMSLIRM